MRKKQDYQSDEQLLQKYYSDENPEWLGDLLERYTALLLGVALKYLKDEYAAKDIVQTVFYKALSEIPKKEIKNIGAWLYQVAKNECFNHFRMQKNMLDEEVLEQVQSPDEILIVNLLKEEEKSLILKNAVEDLNADQKQSINLFYFEQKSYQQISELMNVSIKQVKSNIQNAKRNLKNTLESTPEIFKEKEHD